MMMKEISQPKFLARSGIVRGAKSAPMEAPALNMDVAKALSFFGKYSAVVLMAAGKLPASPSARMLLATMKQYMLIVEMSTAVSPVAWTSSAAVLSPTTLSVTTPHRAWAQAPADHTPIAQR